MADFIATTVCNPAIINNVSDKASAERKADDKDSG